MEGVKLSVIVPVHNAEATIGRCLDSLLNQGVSSYEVICVENGSIDDSLQMLRRYESLYGDIVKVFSISDASVSSARNYGIQMASGEVLTFCDADDYLIPNAYGYLLDNYWEEGVCLLKFNSVTLDKYALRTWKETNDVTGRLLYEGKSRAFVNEVRCVPTFVWNHFYRKSFLNSCSLKFEPLVVGEDGLFNMRVYMADVNMRAVSSNVYRYTVSENQVTRNRNVDLMRRTSWAFVALFEYMLMCIERCSDIREALFSHMEGQLYTFLSRVLSSDFSYKDFCLFKQRLSEKGLLSAGMHTKMYVVMRVCMSCFLVYKMVSLLFRNVFIPYVLPRMSRN